MMKGNVLSALGLSKLLLIALEEHKPAASRRRRALLWERPTTPFAHFARREYALPEETLSDFGWAISFYPELMRYFDLYLVNQGQPRRDFLVCTHGSRDAACGKFGYQLYDRLKELAAVDPQLCVWRVSHIGNHVFAPTMVELPTGIFWGNLSDDIALQVVERGGDVAQMRRHYCGWSGAARGFAQAAEREVFLREGWSWLDRPRTVEVIAQDPRESPQWAEVRITFDEGADKPCVYTARVEVSHYIETMSSTEDAHPRPYAQYSVTQLERVQSHFLEANVGAYGVDRYGENK
jgi:hypothetical protein